MVNDTKRDALLVASALYWGEGDKREFGLSNTDPHLITTFLECLCCLGLDMKRIKIELRIYNDIDVRDARAYWIGVTKLDSSAIKRVDTLQGKKAGKLPYGMCRLRLEKGNDFFNLLMATIEEIKT